MTTAQGVELGPVSLPVYRLVLAAGLLRVVVRREVMFGSINTIDILMVALCGWMMLASFFHQWAPGSGPVYTAGVVFNLASVYILTRVLCRDLSELTAVLRIVGFLLVPVALAMTAEHLIHRNLFGVFGGVSESVYIRDGKIRAQGPFAHPILAGTVGAVCLPLMIGIWRSGRSSATIGALACIVIAFASTSSGPLISLMAGVSAILTYAFRQRVWIVRWLAVAAYIAAELLMTRPAYYLISKFDLTGSSTGWHRARLINSAVEHISEWWSVGTDYTGHWMPYTLDEDGRHSDITNYYLFIGVIAGLPAVLLLVAILWRGFVYVGQCVRRATGEFQSQRFLMWCLGAGLFAHALTSLSVAYFDQSMMFFWLNIAIVSGMYCALEIAANRESLSPTGSRSTHAPSRVRGRSPRLAYPRGVRVGNPPRSQT
jgi:hypothetical protein